MFKFKENFSITLEKPKALTESTDSSVIPKVLFPKMRCINANKVTKNKTYYPKESLIGNGKTSGFASMLYPYPVPIILEHNLSGDLFKPASEVYGRARQAFFDEKENAVILIPAITEEVAIRKILSESFLTLSIGVETDSVTCSICNKRIDTGDCSEHQKGQVYIENGSPVECYWIIGEVYFNEVSFVNSPSDDEARITVKDVNGSSLINREAHHSGSFMLGFPSIAPKLSITESEGVQMKMNTIGKLVDPKYRKEYNVFQVTDPKHTLEMINKSNLPQTEELKKALVKLCLDEKLELPEDLKGIEAAETSIVAIELDEKNYGLLHALLEAPNLNETNKVKELEALLEKAKGENSKLIEKNTELNSKPNTEVNESQEVIAKLTTELEEMQSKFDVLGGLSSELESTTKELTETKASYTLVLDSSVELAESVKRLQDELIEQTSTNKKLLAREIAILSRYVNSRSAREKTIEQLATELESRTLSSLEDKRQDLLLEMPATGPVVDINNLEHVVNPALGENNSEQTRDNKSVSAIEKSEKETLEWFNYKPTKKENDTRQA